jgi:type II secretion system protein G
MTSPSRYLSRRFTLIELLVTIVIIVVLAGVLMAASRAVLIKTRQAKTKAQMQALMSAFEQYQQDWGFFPQQDSAGIPRKLIEGSGGNAGLVKASNQRPYLDLAASGLGYKDDQLVDPFGNHYRYLSPGVFNEGTFDLWSLGPNGVDDTAANGASGQFGDDLCSWRRLD